LATSRNLFFAFHIGDYANAIWARKRSASARSPRHGEYPEPENVTYHKGEEIQHIGCVYQKINLERHCLSPLPLIVAALAQNPRCGLYAGHRRWRRCRSTRRRRRSRAGRRRRSDWHRLSLHARGQGSRGSTAGPSPRRSPTCSPAGRRGASSDGGSRPAVRSRPRVSDRRRSGGAAQCCRGCWTRRVQPALGRTVLPARKADVRSSVDTDARWRKRLTATPAYQILSALGADSGLRCSRGHRDDGCRAPQVEPESSRRAADPYHRLVA
jgi:hypothetical protein